MLRVVVFQQDRELGYALFQMAQTAVRKCNVKCELTHTAEAARILSNLTRERRYYDVFLLDSRDPVALKLAGELRKVNLTAAILFLKGGDVALNTLLQYRPSGLVEPQEEEELVKLLVSSITEQVRSNRYFTIRSKEALTRVNFEDISHIESRQRIAVLYAGGKVYEFYAKLGDIFETLPQDIFVRCHQSYVVNMRHVRMLDKTRRCFQLHSGVIVEISKANYAQTLAQYTAFLENS